MVMYGLSWIFGFFSVSEGAIVFQWLFLIFNTTQGFSLFVMFCILNEDGRKEWKNLLQCKTNKKREKTSSGTYKSRKYPATKSSITKESSIAINESVIHPADKMSGNIDNAIKTATNQPNIDDKDNNLLIINEQLCSAPIEEDIQFPPHVMIKLNKTANSIEPKRKQRRPAALNLALNDQVPPHITQRLRRQQDSYDVFTNDFSLSEDGFSLDSRGSQASFSQMTDIYTLSEEDEFF